MTYFYSIEHLLQSCYISTREKSDARSYLLSSVWRCRYWVSCLWNVLNLFFKCHPGYANSPCFENLMFFSFLSKDTTFVQTRKIPINLSHHQVIFLRVTLTVCSYFNLYFNYLHLRGPTFLFLSRVFQDTYGERQQNSISFVYW